MMRPLAPVKDGPSLLVSELIDQVNKIWNPEALNEQLLPIDREVVRQIPLPLLGMDDRWRGARRNKKLFCQVCVSNACSYKKHKRGMA